MSIDYSDLLKKLKKQEKTESLSDFRLFNLCTFKIGGKADLVVSPETESDFITTLGMLSESNIPYLVVGSASNLLFSDDGFNGAIVRTHRLNALTVHGNILTAEAGVPLSKLSQAAMRCGSGGFHGLCGIPGRVGGSLVTASGAFGCNIYDHIRSCRIYLPKENRIEELPLQPDDFSYRTCPTILKNATLLSASFNLIPNPEPQESIQAKITACSEKRKATQPQGVPSAGSYFKRPENAPPAAYLIDQAGLKGARVGGAQVSEKHAGFIINVGNATAKDVQALADQIKTEIIKTYGVELKEEVIFIPKTGR